VETPELIGNLLRSGRTWADRFSHGDSCDMNASLCELREQGFSHCTNTRFSYAHGQVVVPGVEGSGVITAMGAEVKEFKIGDRVAWAFARGSYAELINVAEDSLVKLPEARPRRIAFSRAGGAGQAITCKVSQVATRRTAGSVT
jgi:Alcohol dehydrogenase GroES-like domain